MAYLGNGAVNRVNLHSGIHALAHGLGGVFFLVFLLHAGVSVPVVLLAQAGIVAGRFVLRPALLPLATRWGLKPLLIAGTFGVALQYPLLAEVEGAGGALLTLCLVASLGDVFYWPAYHAYYASIGDAEHRGHQVSAREALSAMMGIAAPLIGAWALTTAGPHWLFAVTGLVQAAAALPLIGAPNILVKRNAPGAFKAARLGALLIAIDGWFDACFIVVWQIALFGALASSIPAYGSAMSLAGVVGAVCGLWLGRHIDAGHGGRAVLIATATATALVLLRASSLGSPWLAVAANALGALLWPLLIPVLATPTYNMAKTSPCAFRFQMATEGGWDVGCFLACLIAAALVAWGAPLAVPFMLALPAVAAAAILLRRYYVARPFGSGAENTRNS
jgi:DHA1 family inner membrane transport protein